MISIERFKESTSWAFSEIDDVLAIGVRPGLPGQYEISSDWLLDRITVVGIEPAHEAILGTIAHRAFVLKDRRDGRWPVHFEFKTEEGGFKPGTFEPKPRAKLIARVYGLHEPERRALIVGGDLTAEGKHAVEMRLHEDGEWEIVPFSGVFDQIAEEDMSAWVAPTYRQCKADGFAAEEGFAPR